MAGERKFPTWVSALGLSVSLATYWKTATREVYKRALTILAVLPAPQKANDTSFLKYVWALQLLLLLSPCLPSFYPSLPSVHSVLSIAPSPAVAFSMPISASRKTSLQPRSNGFLGIHTLLLQLQ